MLKFGSVFKYRDKSYVYLGADAEAIFAALILEHDATHELQRIADLRAKTPAHPIHQGTVLCFVILSTAEFYERAAWLHNAAENVSIATGIEPYRELEQADIEILKTQILEDGVIPTKLKEIVRITFA